MGGDISRHIVRVRLKGCLNHIGDPFDKWKAYSDTSFWPTIGIIAEKSLVVQLF